MLLFFKKIIIARSILLKSLIIFIILSSCLYSCDNSDKNADNALSAIEEDTTIIYPADESVFPIDEEEVSELNPPIESAIVSSVKLNGAFDIVKGKYVYTKKSYDYYDIEENYNVTRTKLYVNNEPQEVVEDIDKDLPDKNKGEYTRLRISSIDENQIKINDEIAFNLEGEIIQTSVELEYEYVNGNYEDFLSGRDVQIKLTNKGLKDSKLFLEDFFEKSMLKPIEHLFTKQIKKELKNDVKDSFEDYFKIVANTKLSIEDIPNDTMKISRNMFIHQLSKPLKFNLNVNIYVVKK